MRTRLQQDRALRCVQACRLHVLHYIIYTGPEVCCICTPSCNVYTSRPVPSRPITSHITCRWLAFIDLDEVLVLMQQPVGEMQQLCDPALLVAGWMHAALSQAPVKALCGTTMPHAYVHARNSV